MKTLSTITLFITILVLCTFSSAHQDMRIWKSYQPFEPVDLNPLRDISCADDEDQCQDTIKSIFFRNRRRAARFSGMILMKSAGADHEDMINSNYAIDFGFGAAHNNPGNTPEWVILPTSTRDVALAVKECKKTSGCSLTIKGGSGNPNGATLSDSYLMDMSNLNEDAWEFEAPYTSVTAGAGHIIREVIDPMTAQGKTLPVIPDYTGITVGGVTQIGGVGPATPFSGAMVDQVTSFKYVNSRGKVRKCKSGDKCFDVVLCGMGQFGVITEITFPAVASSPFYRVVHLVVEQADVYFDLITTLTTDSPVPISGVQSFMKESNVDGIAGTIANASQMFARPDFLAWLETTEKTWLYIIEITVDIASPADPMADWFGLIDEVVPQHSIFWAELPSNLWDNRLLEIVLPYLIDIGAWGLPNVWMQVMYSESDARIALPQLFDGPGAYNNMFELGFGHIGLYPYPKDVFTKQFFAVPATEDEIVFLLVLGKSNLADVEAPPFSSIAQQKADNKAIWDAAFEAPYSGDGVTTYPQNLVDFDSSDWADNFNTVWCDFTNAKLKYDKKNIFQDNRGFGFGSETAGRHHSDELVHEVVRLNSSPVVSMTVFLTVVVSLLF